MENVTAYVVSVISSMNVGVTQRRNNMAIVFGISLVTDVLLAMALLKLTEKLNDLMDKVKHIEQKTNSQYDLLRKYCYDQYMSLNARCNVHRMLHIMKGDKI